MTRDETINVIHKTIYQFFDGGDGEPMSDKDELLLAVNKAICNNIKALEQEPSGDAISRQDALGVVHAWIERREYRTANPLAYIWNGLKALPSVTPKQRTGHWEMCEDADGIYGVCDICGTDADFSHYGKAYPYCPNCGAKMESEEQE